MSESHSGTSVSTNMNTSDNTSKRKATSKQWMVAVIVLFVFYSGVNYFQKKDAHVKTLQNIIDGDERLNKLKVVSARIPFYISIPFSEYLTEAGILPGSYTEFFVLERKDKKVMSGKCAYETYDYTVKQSTVENIFFSINGTNVEKMMDCG